MDRTLFECLATVSYRSSSFVPVRLSRGLFLLAQTDLVRNHDGSNVIPQTAEIY